ncbi:mucolipin-3-like isoform X1 [Homalodisca vitripennis]|uniref:mucolipin-3-like isoform X1 n=1 Tax=Homalodisca vitripennis TaxID=197043 RepID=UPI001EEC0B3F|nr:mucolipin-3-like isoform X1 [Homalodisca vitripennis]
MSDLPQTNNLLEDNLNQFPINNLLEGHNVAPNNVDEVGQNRVPNNVGHEDEDLYLWRGRRDLSEERESLMPVIPPSQHEDHLSPDPESVRSTTYENRMKRKLRFFFMNPIEKWQAKQRFPYKFLVQVFKIIFVTIQLYLFADNRYYHVNYSWDNRISFSHLFLRGWSEEREVNAYPPNLGPLAIYKKDDFFDTIDYAVIGYASLSDAVGPYSYTNEDNSMAPPQLCLYNYKEGIIFGFNESYVFNNDIIEDCKDLKIPSSEAKSFSSRKFFKNQNITITFSALVKVTLKFSIKTVNFKAAGPITPPDCYKFNIQILFDNDDMDGQMILSLDAEPIRLICNGDVEYINDNRLAYILRSILNIVVILICCTSCILCSRAIWKAQLLKRETMDFFRIVYNRELSLEGRFEFWNFWYIMIIVDDILLILGSAIKEEIERKQFIGDQWNTCSLLLGTGTLLVWFGVLRYLGFFKTYNVVILTLKSAFPKVARFLLCALLIYAGFTFCGWLVLGPYHMKFRSLASTSECLFALINGDDMFATFSMMEFKSPMLWWFSRIYLYSFISLFIYVVLSLFISVIMDSYDTIKLYYEKGFPKTDLQLFVAECQEEPSSGAFRNLGEAPNRSSIRQVMDRLCCCQLNVWPRLAHKHKKLMDDSTSTEYSGCI